MSQADRPKQEPLLHLNPAEHALNVLIEADKKETSGRLNHGVHFIFKMIQNDPALVQKFCDCFLGKIIKEVEELGKAGSFSDLTRRQMAVGLYQALPQMKEVTKKFDMQVSAKQFPWVQQFIDKTTQSLEKGLKTADDALVVETIQDIGRYSAATGGHPLFTTLMKSAKEKIDQFFHQEGASSKVQAQLVSLAPKLLSFGIELKKPASAPSR